MSAITNFHPIKAINSLLQPLGLAVSNRQQIISKAALAALAMISLNYVLVEAITCREACVINHCQGGCHSSKGTNDAYTACYYQCFLKGD